LLVSTARMFFPYELYGAGGFNTNKQLNEFFLDYPDYNFFSSMAHKDYEMHYYLEFFKKNSRLIGGNFGHSIMTKKSVFDFMFFKTFYYRYKNKIADNYYLKLLTNVNEFVLHFIDLKSEHLNFSFLYFFSYLWKLISKQLE